MSLWVPVATASQMMMISTGIRWMRRWSRPRVKGCHRVRLYFDYFPSTLDYVFVQCSVAVLFLKCCFIWVWLSGTLRFSRWFLRGIFCKLKGLALLCGEYKGLKEEKETWYCWGRPKENRRVTWKLIWSSTRSRQTGLSKRKGRQT